MNNSSRRRFLGVAGAGAAAAGAVAVAPTVISSLGGGKAALAGESATESVVAHVADITSAELTLLVGEREILVHDRDLVVRLLNAAGR